MSDHATAFDGCQCGDPANRSYPFSDWGQSPARLYWHCQVCGDVGVLFIHHRRSGESPRSIATAPIEQRVRWTAIERATTRLAAYAPTFDLTVSELELTAALNTHRERLRVDREREEAEAADLREAAVAVANRERDRYRALRARLMSWHDRRRVEGQPPESSFEVLVGGGEAVAVYALVDPDEPERVRYVGKTNNPMGRYQDHCKNNSWAVELLAKGRTPTMLLIEWTPTNEDALRRERDWINHYRALGMADVNVVVPRQEAA